MTIFSVLKQEHRNVKKLFTELFDWHEGSEKSLTELFYLLKQELISHAEAERKSLYDRLIDEPATHEVVVSSERGHGAVLKLLEVLDTTNIQDPAWMRMLEALKRHVESHVEEEENIIFPRAKAILEKNEQKEIAEDFRDRKYSLLENFA